MPMSKQEIFNKVMTHLFTQGKPAKTRKGDCRYRTKNGLKCAAGVLIPDEMYRTTMEEKCIYDVCKYYSDVHRHLGEENIGLIASLQDLHDGLYGNDVWWTTNNMRKAAREIAEMFGLDASVVDTLSFSDR